MRFDHKCQCCSPTPAVVRATDQAHALALVKRARNVYVHVDVSGGRIFRVTKREALSELSRTSAIPPRVSLHLGGQSAFIG